MDAMGSIPKGIMKGNREDLGFYDECVGISQEIENDTIQGRYCYAGLILPLPNISLIEQDTRMQVMQYMHFYMMFNLYLSLSTAYQCGFVT